jgi:hypothetical protein
VRVGVHEAVISEIRLGWSEGRVEVQALDEKDYSPDGKDRDEWNRLWRARAQRLLPDGCKLNLNLGHNLSSLKLTAVSIAYDPPEFAGLVFRASEACPICGKSTAKCARVAATLNLTFAFEDRLSLGMGVWAHRPCFESCSYTGEPGCVPW